MKESEIIKEERRYNIAKLFFLRVQRNLTVHHSAANYLDMIVQFTERPDFKIGVELKPYNTKINSNQIQSLLKSINFSLDMQQFNYPVLIMLVDERHERAKIGLITSLDKRNKLNVIEKPQLLEASSETVNVLLDEIIVWYKTNSRLSNIEV
jgi:hypothetical protein